MVEHREFVYEDPFSYAPENSPWTNVHWLFQLFMYGVYSVGGVAGLILAKAAVFTAACAILVLTSRRKETLALSVALCAVLVYSMRFLIVARPIVFTLLYLALFVLVLETWRRSKNRRILLLLPAIQILWANTQGLYPLGPAAIACYLAGDAAALLLAKAEFHIVKLDARLSWPEIRTLLYVLLATCAACIVTPYGIHGLALPALLYERIEPSLAGIYSWNVLENLPSWYIIETAPERLGWLVWAGLLAAASFVVARKALSLPRALLFVAFLYIGLIAERNLPLYVFVLCSIVMGNVDAAIESGPLRRRPVLVNLPRFGAVAAGAAFVLCGIGIIRSARLNESTLGMAPFRYPVEAAEILARKPFNGNVLNSVKYGGYLIWRLYPSKKVFIDGRLAIRSREAFAEYLQLLDEPSRFPEYQQKYGITRVVLPTAAFLRYLRLALWFCNDRDWRLIYCDGACVLFAYDPAHAMQFVDLYSEADVGAIVNELERRYAHSMYVREQAKQNLGAFLLSLGSLVMAEKVLAPLHSSEARTYLARCYYLRGRVGDAEKLCNALLAENSRNTNCLNLLGRICLDKGDYEKALGYIRACLKADPYNKQARETLDEIEKQVGGVPK